MGRIIKGDELMLFKDDKSIAFATTHTLTITGETLDNNCKDYGVFGSRNIGKMSWEITSENLYSDEDFDMLFGLMVNKTQFTVVFGSANYDIKGLNGKANWTNNVNNTFYTGKCVITSVTNNANTGEIASFSITLTGVGAITSMYSISNDTTLANALYTKGLIANTDYITNTEAADITEEQLKETLKEVSLTSFNEFEYFTNVTVLNESTFQSSTLTSIVFPSSFKEIGRYMFRYDSRLTSVTLNEGLVRIRDAAFRQCTGLTTLTIPSTVIDIRGNAITGCTNLTKIIFLCATPPSFGNYPFDNKETLTIYVPIGCTQAYTTALTGKFGSDAIKFTIRESN